MEFLNNLLNQLSGLLSLPVLSSIAIGIEILFRFIPSEKPKSILYLISDGVKIVAKLFEGVGLLLDKVLPQRLK